MLLPRAAAPWWWSVTGSPDRHRRTWMMGWGPRADEDIGPYDLGPLCVARDDPARAAGGASPSPTVLQGVRRSPGPFPSSGSSGHFPPREGFQATPAVHHPMTREDQQQAPSRWGLPICPQGTRGGEHKGAERCYGSPTGAQRSGSGWERTSKGAKCSFPR